MELPASNVGTLTTAQEYKFSVEKDRNYTAYYDTATYSSLWVAYPLAAGHCTDDAKRTSAWKAAPDIETDYQINIWDGSYGVSYGDGNSQIYARGHQIPKADRRAIAAMQDQTYYAINSTPQMQVDFNAKIWSSLEDGVRGVIPQNDTLYVVTGPVYRTVGGNESVELISPKNESVKRCPVPNYYFKAVLKVKRDNTGSVTSASAIGFWFRHEIHSTTDYTAYAVSVDLIESKTGFDLFANLPAAVESAAEQNTSWTTFSGF